MPSDALPQVPATFENAAAEFGRLTVILDSAENRQADHDVIERAIEIGGREVLRRLYQDWLTERARTEPRRDVVGADDVMRQHHRLATRPLESLFGTVQVLRDRVGFPGSPALAPVDAVLKLADDRFTYGVRERVATEAIRGSFDAAVSAMSETTGAAVVKRQAEELVGAAAIDFDAFYESERCRDATTATASDLLVLTADGKGIVMRPSGLRPATCLAAEKAAHKLSTRLSKGEKRNRKRMAVVAAVYDLEAVARTPSDVLGELNRTSTAPRPRARQKRVWASVEKTPGAVIAEMFAEAERRDPTHARRWVALVDGNKTQIQEIRAAARAAGVAITLVLDFIHVTEYLWDAAWELFSEGDPAAEAWVRKYLDALLRGRASIVAAAIRRTATNLKLDKRTSIDAAADYLLGHVWMLRYDEFLRDGLPIATGVIEGACRHLVKDRMDITGARWGLPGAEAMLRLRSLSVSGDLPQYWKFHKEREFERNHVSRYAAIETEWLGQRVA